MNKKELISRVTEKLRDSNTRKPVSIKKHKFRITDDEGNSADFNIKQRNKDVLYNVNDTSAIIDTAIAVIVDAIKNGEEVSIHGFGTLGLHYRAARKTKEPNSGEWCDVEARYVPRFSFGNDLRVAAKLYELSIDSEEGGEE